MKSTWVRWSLAAVLLITMILVAACGGAKQPTTVAAPARRVALKVGYLNVMDDAQAMLAKDGGFYDKHGLDVDLQLFASGTDLIKAIVGGQLQAGVLGFTNAATWVAQGADLKVVGGAQMGYHSILVRKGSGINSVADLKGKRLASQKQGSTADVILGGVVFPGAGLARKDVNLVYVEPPVAIQSLMAGQVDAAFVFEPYESIARATSDIQSIYEVGKVWPFPCMVVITSGKQLTADRDAINRLLDAQKDAMLMMQKQPGEAAKLLAKRFIPDDELTGPGGKVPAVNVITQAIQSQMFHWDISPDDVKRMAEVVDIMVDQGVMTRKIDVNSFLDLSWQKR